MLNDTFRCFVDVLSQTNWGCDITGFKKISLRTQCNNILIHPIIAQYNSLPPIIWLFLKSIYTWIYINKHVHKSGQKTSIIIIIIIIACESTKDPCSLSKCHGFSMSWPIKEHTSTFSKSFIIWKIFSSCIIKNTGLMVNCGWWINFCIKSGCFIMVSYCTSQHYFYHSKMSIIFCNILWLTYIEICFNEEYQSIL